MFHFKVVTVAPSSEGVVFKLKSYGAVISLEVLDDRTFLLYVKEEHRRFFRRVLDEMFRDGVISEYEF